MNRKLQVFISSTFRDMEDERQAAVEAVLKAGHIPAGMELFTPADESQKQTIEKWIKESDVYVLILGGRYGTIEPVTKKSYTHWEYDLAGEMGIPRFAVVISDVALNKKVKKMQQAAIEMEDQEAYKKFKAFVTSKTSHFFDDTKDIKLTIVQKLGEYTKDEKLTGWISGREVKHIGQLIKSITELTKENNSLKTELARQKSTNRSPASPPQKTYDSGTIDFRDRMERILQVLGAKQISRGLHGNIVWAIHDDDGEEIKSFEFNHPPHTFKSYFILDADGNYDKLLIVSILDDVEDVKTAFGDIRVLLDKFSTAEAVPIRFVIGLEGQHGQLQNRADIFLQRAKKITALVEDELYGVEIWDTNVINNFEEDLGFKL